MNGYRQLKLPGAHEAEGGTSAARLRPGSGTEIVGFSHRHAAAVGNSRTPLVRLQLRSAQCFTILNGGS